ncbi:hypothetical protein NPIL_54991 [Nephila pilipes]|uniref:Uncharacterized protein n=1 Tax=Nephila pilipes TaxID=299642 RepID=A0A8X6Q9D2_NEPPI|nr:hypothetical protein NPIL_54991 [Nephila pilipes]
MPRTWEMSCVQKKHYQIPVSVRRRQRQRNFMRAACHRGHTLRRTFMDILIVWLPDIKPSEWPSPPLTRYGALNRLLTLNQAFSLWVVLSTRLPRNLSDEKWLHSPNCDKGIGKDYLGGFGGHI